MDFRAGLKKCGLIDSVEEARMGHLTRVVPGVGTRWHTLLSPHISCLAAPSWQPTST